MVPILLVHHRGTRCASQPRSGLLLALAHSQGMALVYTGLGVAAGLLGQGLGLLAAPHRGVGVRGPDGVAVVVDVRFVPSCKLPAAVQGWLGGQQPPARRAFCECVRHGCGVGAGGQPCVSAPLAGALLYISQTHDVVLGGSALYAMAWGMSVPLLLVGLSAGSLLPRTGPWMKGGQGLVRIDHAGHGCVGQPPCVAVSGRAGQGADAVVSTHRSVLPFERVRTVAELDAALDQARQAGQPVMLDFYADWCTSCLELEHQTFVDPTVQARLKPVRLLQADVTANTEGRPSAAAALSAIWPAWHRVLRQQGREQVGSASLAISRRQIFLASLQRSGL